MSNLVPNPPLSDPVTRYAIVRFGASRASASYLSGRALNIINAQASWKKLEAGSKLEKKGMNKMNKLNKEAAITNVVIVIIMFLLMQAAYLKGERAGTEKVLSHVYPLSGIVTKVDQQKDRVIVTDAIGNKWEFNGIEDWQEGDITAMIMYDNRTEEIYDDKIIDIHYIGWIE